MTYDDLTAAILSALDLTSNADIGTYLPRITEGAELRCYRDLDPLGCRARTTQSFSSASVAPPTDMVALRSLSLLSGTVTLSPFEQRDLSFLAEYAPDSSATGQPRYWALADAGTIIVAPAPAQTYTLGIVYTQRPAPLSAQTETTWLSAHYPDLLRFAALVEAAGWMKNFGAQSDDPKMALSWEQMYQGALVSARAEESRRKLEPAFDTGSPTPIKSTNAPVG